MDYLLNWCYYFLYKLNYYCYIRCCFAHCQAIRLHSFASFWLSGQISTFDAQFIYFSICFKALCTLLHTKFGCPNYLHWAVYRICAVKPTYWFANRIFFDAATREVNVSPHFSVLLFGMLLTTFLCFFYSISSITLISVAVHSSFLIFTRHFVYIFFTQLPYLYPSFMISMAAKYYLKLFYISSSFFYILLSLSI